MTEGQPKLAEQFALRRLQVAILEGRIRDCPHEWGPVSEVVEIAYAKGFTFDDKPRPAIHFRAVTSVCGLCGSTIKTREKIDG